MTATEEMELEYNYNELTCFGFYIILHIKRILRIYVS